MSETIYHWHHIIPRHAGGTDDPSNLVKLTIQEHAEAHKLLWEQYGRPQDKLAWLLLSGQGEEGWKLAQELAIKAKQTPEFREKVRRQWENDEFRELMSMVVSNRNKKMWQNDEYREMMTNMAKENTTKRNKENWKDPIYREKMLTILESTKEQRRQKLIERNKENWKNPEYREKMLKKMKDGKNKGGGKVSATT